MSVSNYYLDFIEDENDDLVEVDYYHRACASADLKAMGGWPCPEWPDYNVYCAGCDELIHKAIGEDD